MINHTFSKEKNKEFSKTLNSRVNHYFKNNRLKRTANSKMVVKTIVLIGIYLGSFITILTIDSSSPAIFFALWVLLGFAMAFIGTAVMHDSLHGSYSRNKYVNNILSISAYLVGANPRIWKIQHNMLHHTYTNIEHADEDIDARFVLRFTPHQKRRWFHRWQHIYAILFYSLMTLLWVTVKDFNRLFKYRAKGFVSKGSDFRKLLTIIILQKIAYHMVFLGLPLLLLPFSTWLIVMMFISAHLVAGATLALIFQCAHVTPSSAFIIQDEQVIDENWAVHQLLTTSNFARKNKLIGWLFGGLNFQIEHHLFPNVCHVHYPKISRIVKNTAIEFGIPYYERKSFVESVFLHLKLLRQLGRSNINPTKQIA